MVYFLYFHQNILPVVSQQHPVWSNQNFLQTFRLQLHNHRASVHQNFFPPIVPCPLHLHNRDLRNIHMRLFVPPGNSIRPGSS